jgi:hypothetical protein
MFQRNFLELVGNNPKDVKEGLNKNQFSELLKQSNVKLDEDTTNRMFEVSLFSFTNELLKSNVDRG